MHSTAYSTARLTPADTHTRLLAAGPILAVSACVRDSPRPAFRVPLLFLSAKVDGRSGCYLKAAFRPQAVSSESAARSASATTAR
jgi:hypothetical protein